MFSCKKMSVFCVSLYCIVGWLICWLVDWLVRGFAGTYVSLFCLVGTTHESMFMLLRIRVYVWLLRRGVYV